MSVELYPTLEALDEKLASLEDPILSERIVSENPALFPSAAAQEEISVFAAAWKRFGTLALAVTAAASIVAGYVLTPMVLKQPAPAQHVAASAPSPHHDALAARVRRDEADLARLRARVAAQEAAAKRAAAVAPVVIVKPVIVKPVIVKPVIVKPVMDAKPISHAAIPVHHAAAVPVHHAAVAPAPVSHALPASNPQTRPEPEGQADNTLSAQAGSPSQVGSSPSTTTSTSTDQGPIPTTDAPSPPDGTKRPPSGNGGRWGAHWPAGIGGVILGPTADPCSPSGGRIGRVLESIAGQFLGSGGRF